MYCCCKSAVLFIPNVITPNQDSFNDVWKVGNIEYFKNAKLAIYDRYGKKVFYTEDISKFNWDGFYLGRVLPSDTCIGTLSKYKTIIPEQAGFF